MSVRDPHRFVNELDDDAVERLVQRLESRAKDDVFARLFDEYVQRLALPPGSRVLEVGCGTGAMARRLARLTGFSGEIIGADQCAAFIEAAARFAREEGVGDRIEFRTGDAHNLGFPPQSFDAVIAHTVLSHVTDPETVLREMARVLRPGGTMVVFDGDYSSLSYGFPDQEFGQRMDRALAAVTFNNPLIMRDLPRLLPQLGLKLVAAWGNAVAEIGHGSYFRSFADTYAPAVVQAGLLPGDGVGEWLEGQHRAIADGTFFAACNYYTYFIGHA